MEINIQFQESENIIADLTEKSGSGGTYQDGYETGYEAGRKDEWSEFWDDYQDYGNRKDYAFAFTGLGWAKVEFNPKYPIVPTNARQMFRYFSNNQVSTGTVHDMTEICKKIDFSKCTIAHDIFEYAKVKNITCDFSSVEQFNNAFNGLGYIDNVTVKVTEKLKFFLNTFAYSSNLKTLTFMEGSVIACNGLELQTATKLTHESLLSVISALKDFSEDTSGTTYKVTFGETNLAKLTEEEKAVIDSKGWNYS